MRAWCAPDPHSGSGLCRLFTTAPVEKGVARAVQCGAADPVSQYGSAVHTTLPGPQGKPPALPCKTFRRLVAFPTLRSVPPIDTIAPAWLWAFFVLCVLAALFIDFVVLKKQGAYSVSVKEALNWSIVWVLLSLAFNALFLWAIHKDHGAALTNEKSLAVDNIFVSLMIFTYFAVPAEFEKRVLMIGIIVLRTVMSLIGSWLIAEFHCCPMFLPRAWSSSTPRCSSTS
jgi:Integral membrane protein TerC family